MDDAVRRMGSCSVTRAAMWPALGHSIWCVNSDQFPQFKPVDNWFIGKRSHLGDISFNVAGPK